MIDIHSHILPGIDDGSKTIEESIEILKQAEQNGVTDIILTPHYILGSDYNSKYTDNKKLLTKLKRKIKSANININLYLGNEVFVENNMPKMVNDKEITTLKQTKYLLFELPMNYKFNGLSELLFELNCVGYKPVIAHPERYAFLKENPSLICDLIDKGALFQSNIGSFLGKYGKRSKEVAILFLKHNVITFMGSDIHSKHHDFYDRIDECKDIMKKYISEEEIEDLFINNSKILLKNKDIKEKKYIPFKKTLFGKWK